MSGFKEDYNLLNKDIDDKVIQMDLEDKEKINKVEQNNSQKIKINIIIIFFVSKIKNPTIEKNLNESLKKFDDEGKEAISYDELINIMTILGIELIEEEADRMIREEKAHIISDLKFIIGIIAFAAVVSTIILFSFVEMITVLK